MNGKFFRQRDIEEETTRPNHAEGQLFAVVKRRTGALRPVLICFMILGLILSLFFGYTMLSGKREQENRITASAAVADTWKTAIDAATSTTASTFKLTAGWTATQNSTSGFGTTSGYYRNGALYIPAGKKVIIDLAGNTLNRNCTSAISNGYVIYVDGELTLTNSVTTVGYVRGGYSSTSNTTGGVYVSGTGTLNMDNDYARIRYNQTNASYCGAGVYLASGAKMNMTAGYVYTNTTGNNSYSAGGVYVYNNANTVLNMTGGHIQSNTGYAAGGVYVAGANSRINLGGKAYIRSNTCSSTSKTNDLHFANNTAVAHIVAPFVSGASVGMSRAVNGVITDGWETHNAGATMSSYLIPSDSAFDIYETEHTVGTTTTKEAFYSSRSNATNWDWFISRSASTGTWQTVKLYSTWTATSNSFGVSNSYGGALNVPANAKIILDLNGYNVNRALTSAIGSGAVIYVSGQLRIKSSGSTTASVYGGKNSSQSGAGGVQVNSGGSLTLES